MLGNRLSYAVTVVLLLIAAVLRFWDLSTLPPGLNADEITDVRITETVREGRIEVFYDLGGYGRESGYGIALAATTTLTGAGLFGYRILSVFVGMLTLALVYALGTRLYGALAGVAATALLAVNMGHVILTRGISPEMLLPLFVTAVLLALARSLPVYGSRPYREPNALSFAALGVLLGLGFYIHPLSFIVTLLSMTFIAYMVLKRSAITRRVISQTWFAVVILIVIATPYLISSLQAPVLAGASRLLDIAPRVANAFVNGLGGLFIYGDPNPIHNLPGRPLLDLVSGLFLVLGLITALRCWKQSRCVLLLLALLFITPLALITTASPDFPALSGLLPLLALLFGLGISTVFYSVPRNLRPIMAVGLVILTLFNLQWTVRDLFGTWQRLPAMRTAYDARIGELAHYLDSAAPNLPTVVCTEDVRTVITPLELDDTLKLALMMERQDLRLRYANCREALILSQGGEAEQIIFLEPDGYETFNPFLRDWLEAGEIVERDDIPPRSVVLFNATGMLANRAGALMTTAPIAFAPEAPGDPTPTAPPIRLGGNLAFLGYERIWADEYRPGDLIPVLTYWRVDGSLPPDLRLFTHILGDPGALPAAQNDPVSIRADRMLARDVFLQVSYIQLPFSIRAGTYSISVGAYEENADTRLTVFDGDQPRGTRLFIGQITVRR
ncbi:MAG: glycosyltransferase family 39 protein [Anaerolinea sp.]|nr:glycosyltransferase family 39 protein [Anaerolinea sp.]